jgi:hypothetical protein
MDPQSYIVRSQPLPVIDFTAQCYRLLNRGHALLFERFRFRVHINLILLNANRSAV